MRRFILDRMVDISGVSGTGIVAQGVVFDDGVVVVRWGGDTPTMVIHQSIESVSKIHCHNGATEIRWLDHDPMAMVLVRIVRPPERSRHWNGRIDANPPEFIPALKLLRDFFTISLKDAMIKAKRPPTVIGMLTRESAERFKACMSDIGWEVEIIQRGVSDEEICGDGTEPSPG